MKAWVVKEKDKLCSTVVFAETRGKAKSLALWTECCEGANFCDIEVHRLPVIDKYYKEGKLEMDWFNAQDRIALVKDCGFCCDAVIKELCQKCSAKEYCSEHKGE